MGIFLHVLKTTGKKRRCVVPIRKERICLILARQQRLNGTKGKIGEKLCEAALNLVQIEVMSELGEYSGKETGETALLRSILKSFCVGEIAVMDRY